MKWHAVFRLVTVLTLAQNLCGLGAAQSPTPAQQTMPTSTSTTPVRTLPGPFITPLNHSPVDLFRELLEKKPLERIKLLSGRPAATQRLILAKVREYQSLKPEARELRLRATELRWYLWPLMTADPTNRAQRLALVPPALQKSVQERLEQWDRLPAQLQKELLDNEAAIRYFTEAAVNTPGQQEQVLASLSPARRELLERGIRQWQSLSADQRQKIAARFNQFFELTSEERDKALNTLSESERQQIERTLDKFASITPVRRAICIRSFQKFASLSVEERQLFLKNAERWKLMTPSERQDWKDLVSKLSKTPGFTPSFSPIRLSAVTSVTVTNR